MRNGMFVFACALGVTLGGLALADDMADRSNTLASPDGRLCATLSLQPAKGAPSLRQLFYRIERIEGDKRFEVLSASPLGIVRADQAFVNLSTAEVGKVARIDETYTLTSGKRLKCHSLANEQAFSFTNESGARIEVIFRVANDGVAFRYRFPGESAEPLTITAENTGFRLPADATGWMSPFSLPTAWGPAYEENYLPVKAGDPSPKASGWAFPALFQAGKQWLLLTEAGVDGTYCGCRLEQKADDGVYRLRFPDAKEGWGQGAVEPKSKLPWATPWRVIVVADDLAGIVESTLVTDLNPPSKLADASWIKPGRASWSWWSDHKSPQEYKSLVEFVDLSAEMGWEYSLVDANWDLMNNGDARQLSRYAQDKNVKLVLWYNSGGDNNIVTEKPRGCLNLPEVRKFEFKLLNQWGVAGVKIDFFQSDKQNIMGLYEDILRDAAAAKILIDFHGCTLPRGWRRTWPNLLTMEAVRGAECYAFSRAFAEHAPVHNTTLPFTRNVVGPMDYTPCALSDQKYPHLTTNAHELALAVVFESGWLFFADKPAAYRGLPAAAKQYLKDVPVVWDETRLVDGEPGKLAAIARRNGQNWYIGAINGEKKPKTLSLPLKFLSPGNYRTTLIVDGQGPRDLKTGELTVTADKPVELELLPFGGAVLQLRPTASR